MRLVFSYITEAPQCDDSVCSGHGVCEALTNGTVMCDCSAAFSGPTCSIGVDICNTNSCLNGGICAEEEDGSFACICEGRWEGRYCEEGNFLLLVSQIENYS